MAEHIQREYLRKLLREVRNEDRSPEQVADHIINLINLNYTLTKYPICSECGKEHAECVYCEPQDDREPDEKTGED